MNSIKKELQRLDKILSYLIAQFDFRSDESNFKKNGFDNNRIDFLCDERLIFRTNPPVQYKLTQKGIIHISKGGFASEFKKKRIDRTINLLYLLSSIIILFISLLLSIYSSNKMSESVERMEDNLINLTIKTELLNKNHELINERQRVMEDRLESLLIIE